MENYLTSVTKRGLIEIRGSYGMGKSLTAHIAFYAVYNNISKVSNTKWKYDEVFLNQSNGRNLKS